MALSMMQSTMTRQGIINWLQKHLWENRVEHILGTEETAIELAKIFNVNSEQASLAALCHDCAKGMKVDDIMTFAEQYSVTLTDDDIKSPTVLHSLIGGTLASITFGIEDPAILNAIRYHTLGHPDMDDLAKVVFIADKTEARTRLPHLREKVWKILEQTNNLDAGLLECYKQTISYLTEKDAIIHPTTIAVWNKIVLNRS